jgi:hypothetical protein
MVSWHNGGPNACRMVQFLMLDNSTCRRVFFVNLGAKQPESPRRQRETGEHCVICLDFVSIFYATLS